MVACIPNFCIYGLVDPVTGHLRYIGQTTKTPEQRLKAHLYNAGGKWKKTHCYAWVSSLLSKGLQPTLWVVQEGITSKQELNTAERAWIAYFRDVLMFPLTNHTDGGEGGSPDATTREKISRAKRGRKATISQRKARSEMTAGSLNPFYGKKHSLESKRKMSESSKGGRNQNTNKTHCKHGHEFTEDNIFLRKSGGKDCLTCKRRRGRESMRKIYAKRNLILGKEGSK